MRRQRGGNPTTMPVNTPSPASINDFIYTVTNSGKHGHFTPRP